MAATYAYAVDSPARAAISDALYSAIVLVGLWALHFADRIGMTNIAMLFSFAALASMAAFDRDYLRKQFRRLSAGTLWRLCARVARSDALVLARRRSDGTDRQRPRLFRDLLLRVPAHSRCSRSADF